ncbi:MAG: hypothetical protein AAGI44_09345 [Pseudomonadota bacterium]
MSVWNCMILFVLAGFAAGCANMNSIDRRTSFKSDSDRQTKEVGVVHLDANQLIASNSEFGTICAEPSPDALSAVPHSLSGNFSMPSGEAASVASSLSKSSACIGLSTQTIQLLRDDVYRICELYNAKALEQVGVLILQKGYQDMMVGMLAIEQLTGVVNADQAVLPRKTQASAYNSVNSVTEAIDTLERSIAGQDVKVKTATVTTAEAKAEWCAAQKAYEQTLESEQEFDIETRLLSKRNRDEKRHQYELVSADELMQIAI